MAKKPNPEHQDTANMDQPNDQATDQTGSGASSGALAATQTLTIQGIHFTAAAPYVEGHPLTALEANALNHLRGENLRNNFSTSIKKEFDALHADEKKAGYQDDQLSKELPAAAIERLRGVFAAYDASYAFTLRGTRTPVDPITAEARKIARTLVMEALKANKIDTKSLPEGKLDELISGLIEKRPEIRAEAENRIAATKALAGATLGMLGLDAAA